MIEQPLGPIAPSPTCTIPVAKRHTGRSVTLEPLSPIHVPDLWRAAKNADRSWTYLSYGPFPSSADLERHVADLLDRPLQPFFAVVPLGGRPCGWLSLCDIEPRNAAIEIGSVWFAPALQRTRAATEAFYLLLDHAFAIGFHRVAWRCNAHNVASIGAATRLGFGYEGTWRRAQIVKGRWRDTSWFSMLSEDWLANKAVLDHWLADDNFDGDGRQRSSLRTSVTGRVWKSGSRGSHGF